VVRSAEITSRDLKLSWRNIWFYCAIFIIVVATYPWTDFRGYAHWDRIIWVPFQNMRHSLDGLANIALYVPFGFSYVQSRLHMRKGGVIKAAILAALLSVSCEFIRSSVIAAFHRCRMSYRIRLGVIGALIAGKLHVSRVIIDK
jgi:glycopeptide antibiotics resistance protein